MGTTHNSTNDTTPPIIDWNASVTLLGGNATLAKDMLTLLFNELTNIKPRVHELLDTQQFDKLATLSHKLRGGSSYCSVTRLQHSCNALENAIKASTSHDVIANLAKDLLTQIEAVLTAAPPYLETQ